MRKSIVFFLLLAAMVVRSQAQMMPVTQIIQTPYGNVKETYYMGSNMGSNRFNNNFLRSRYGNPNDGAVGKKHHFIIQLQNDSTVYAYNYVDISSKRSCIRVMIKGWERAITPPMTKSITTTSESGFKLDGIVNDSSWLFLAAFGKINTYSPVAEMNIKYATAIQKGNGPIVPLTKENLRQMIGEPTTEELKRLIDRNRLIEALKLYNTGK